MKCSSLGFAPPKFLLRLTSSSSDDGAALQTALHYHDGVVDGPVGLLDELLRSSAEDNGGGVLGGALGEEVEALVSDPLLLEVTALAED